MFGNNVMSLRLLLGIITQSARNVHGESSPGDTSSFTANGIWRRLRNL